MLNQFFYIRGAAKRDVLISGDRILGCTDSGANSVIVQYDNLGNDRDSAQGTVSFAVTAGTGKEFIEELFESSAKKGFVVLADDITASADASQYEGDAVTTGGIV